jgi:hypothetical protein
MDVSSKVSCDSAAAVPLLAASDLGASSTRHVRLARSGLCTREARARGRLEYASSTEDGDELDLRDSPTSFCTTYVGTLFFFFNFSRRVLNRDVSLSLGGKPAAPLFEEIVIIRAPFEMTTQAHLDSAICTGLPRESTQPLPFMDQVGLRTVTPPSEIIGQAVFLNPMTPLCA